MFGLGKKQESKPEVKTMELREVHPHKVTLNRLQLPVKKVNEKALVPEFAHACDAGMDLYNIDAGAIIEPGARGVFPTGIAMAIPEGFVGLIKDKSGLAVKQGLTVMAGVIDSGYRGEIAVVLYNASNERVSIAPHQKIAQMVITSIARPQVNEVDELPEAADDRGLGGFGSTGLKHSSTV